MPSFVESATLRLVDSSSPQIDKITAALQRLEATAKRINGLRLGGASSSFGQPNIAGLNGAVNAVQRLQQTLSQPLRTGSLTRALNRISNIDTSKLNNAAGQINQLATAVRNLASAQNAAGRAPAIGSARQLQALAGSRGDGHGGGSAWYNRPYSPGMLGTAERFATWGGLAAGDVCRADVLEPGRPGPDRA